MSVTTWAQVARRSAGVFLSVLMLFLLTACGGLPHTGPVTAGLAADEISGPPDYAFLPDPPPQGASAQQIVEGFLAAASGPADEWAIARQYLTEEFAEEWDPNAGVIIDALDERLFDELSDSQVAVTLTPLATVDATGSYATADPGPIPLEFQLIARSDGELRISQAPAGVVLDEDLFESATVYRSYALMYFDPTWRYLVPDARWFPATNPATRIAHALIDGTPSPWLDGAVASAFPADVELESQAVPVSGGTARVALDAAALQVEPLTLDRMQTQLEESLATAAIPAVTMSVDGTSLDAERVSTSSTRVDTLPLVETAEGWGFLTGAGVEVLQPLTEQLALTEANAVQIARGGETAAVREAGGSVLRVSISDPIAVHDSRAGLIEPTLDPQGFIWSVPRGAPADLLAFDGEGVARDITNAWPGVTEIVSMQLSRDGTRMVAVVVTGGRTALWVSGVLRDENGVPTALGEPLPLAPLTGSGLDVAWLDDSTVGVITSTGDESFLVVQPIGGIVTTLAGPIGAVSLAGANLPSTVRVLDADGNLYSKRGATWQETATGVLVLATQQGSIK